MFYSERTECAIQYNRGAETRESEQNFLSFPFKCSIKKDRKQECMNQLGRASCLKDFVTIRRRIIKNVKCQRADIDVR